MNLRQLKEFKGNAANEVDLARLVRTRTCGTLPVLNTNGTANNPTMATEAAVTPNGVATNGKASNGHNSIGSNSRGRSGLAFAISGLNLDDV